MKTIIFSTLRWNFRRNDKMISERQKSTGYSFTMDKRFGWMVPKGVNNKQFPEFIPYQTFVVGEKIKIDHCARREPTIDDADGSNFLVRLPSIDSLCLGYYNIQCKQLKFNKSHSHSDNGYN